MFRFSALNLTPASPSKFCCSSLTATTTRRKVQALTTVSSSSSSSSSVFFSSCPSSFLSSATLSSVATPLMTMRHFHFAGMPHEGNQANFSGVNKSNRYVNTAATAAPVHTACGRKFDPMVFQELLQASCDPNWSSAIQRGLVEDKEYMEMLRSQGGGAIAIDQLMMQGGLGGSDEDAMKNLKKLLQSDKKAALSVCAVQDSYIRIRDKRDLDQTKLAADGGGGDAFSSMKQQRTPFGASTGAGGGGS